MHRICVAIWKTGKWPEEWVFFMFIPLSKKGDLKHCATYRTIALVSHASKIFLRIILERIRVKTDIFRIPKRKLETNRRDSDKEGDKRPNHKSQNIDAQCTRAPTTTLYVLCGLQEGVRLLPC